MKTILTIVTVGANLVYMAMPDIVGAHINASAVTVVQATPSTWRMLKNAGGIPAHGNQVALWDAGCRFDFANPEYRA